ncbi:MAG TPA: hypothetical protein VN775_05055 [Opitutaceae bacterium]|nr:hypothetical protein [Opitutaceae bacterium]
MRNIERISATRAFLDKAASIAASRAFPAWADATEYGAGSSVVMPRVRDNLVLRLVAGRRQERDKNLIHATGAP